MVGETQLKTKLTYLGNIEILKLHKVAFFCSQKCPSHLILKSYDWAIEQRENGVCITSGFHSKIEKDVLDFLLKGTQPIIMVLARNMKKRFPEDQRKAIEENRLLVISPFDDKITQNSKDSCSKRNEIILDLEFRENYTYYLNGNGRNQQGGYFTYNCNQLLNKNGWQIIEGRDKSVQT